MSRTPAGKERAMKMRPTTQRHTLFNWLSLGIVLPFLLVCLLISHIAFSRQEASETEFLARQADMVAESLRERYQFYLQNSIVLAEEPMLQPTSLLPNNYQSLQGIRHLKNANRFNGRTEDVFIYFGRGKIYSAKGLTNVTSFFTDATLLYCTPAALEAAKSALGSGQAVACPLPARDGGCSVMLHFPFPESRASGASSNFVFPVSALARLLWNGPLRCSTYVRLYNEAGEEMRFRGAAGGTLQWTPIYPNAAEREKYVVLQRETGVLNLKMEMLFHTDDVYAPLRADVTGHYLITAAAFILSLILIQLLTRMRWRRARQIAAGAPLQSGRYVRDEIDYLSLVMTRNANESASKIRSLRHLLRQQALIMMIHGLWNDETFPEAFGYEMSEEYYFLGGLTWQRSMGEWDEIARQFDLPLTCPIRLNERTGIVLFLAELPNSDESCVMRREKAARLIFQLQKRGIPVCLSLSRPYDRLSMAKYAFDEVTAGLSELEKTQNQLLCYEDIAPLRQDRVLFDKETLDAFQEALKAGSEPDAQEQLTRCLRFISQEGGSPAQQATLREYLLQAVQSSLSRQDDEEADPRALSLSPRDSDFEEKIRQLVSLCCHPSAVSENVLDGKVETALRYLEEHYTRYDLSLEEVAQHIGVSKGYLSRIFKQRLGIGYIDYLTKLRMEKASELLLNTDLNVADVFKSVGYIYKNSYSAKFKAYFGLNASEYRRLKRKN